jgi:hypothetical protein
VHFNAVVAPPPAMSSVAVASVDDGATVALGESALSIAAIEHLLMQVDHVACQTCFASGYSQICVPCWQQNLLKHLIFCFLANSKRFTTGYAANGNVVAQTDFDSHSASENNANSAHDEAPDRTFFQIELSTDSDNVVAVASISLHFGQEVHEYSRFLEYVNRVFALFRDLIANVNESITRFFFQISTRPSARPNHLAAAQPASHDVASLMSAAKGRGGTPPFFQSPNVTQQPVFANHFDTSDSTGHAIPRECNASTSMVSTTAMWANSDNTGASQPLRIDNGNFDASFAPPSALSVSSSVLNAKRLDTTNHLSSQTMPCQSSEMTSRPAEATYGGATFAQTNFGADAAALDVKSKTKFDRLMGWHVTQQCAKLLRNLPDGRVIDFAFVESHVMSDLEKSADIKLSQLNDRDLIRIVVDSIGASSAIDVDRAFLFVFALRRLYFLEYKCDLPTSLREGDHNVGHSKIWPLICSIFDFEIDSTATTAAMERVRKHYVACFNYYPRFKLAPVTMLLPKRVPDWFKSNGHGPLSATQEDFETVVAIVSGDPYLQRCFSRPLPPLAAGTFSPSAAPLSSHSSSLQSSPSSDVSMHTWAPPAAANLAEPSRPTYATLSDKIVSSIFIDLDAELSCAPASSANDPHYLPSNYDLHAESSAATASLSCASTIGTMCESSGDADVNMDSADQWRLSTPPTTSSTTTTTTTTAGRAVEVRLEDGARTTVTADDCGVAGDSFFLALARQIKGGTDVPSSDTEFVLTLRQRMVTYATSEDTRTRLQSHLEMVNPESSEMCWAGLLHNLQEHGFSVDDIIDFGGVVAAWCLGHQIVVFQKNILPECFKAPRRRVKLPINCTSTAIASCRCASRAV